VAGLTELANRIGVWWTVVSIVPPGLLAWLLAGLFVSPTLRNYAFGATVVGAALAFLIAGSGVAVWTPRRRHEVAVRALVLFVVSGLVCAYLLTALRADVAARFAFFTAVGNFLVVATPFSNFLIAIVWGFTIGALVFALVALSPYLPH
jgi:hypothetical protein